MDVIGGLLAYADAAETRKKLRYAVVAIAFLPLGQCLLQVLGASLNDYTAASLLAGALTTVPNFFLNRRYVWRVTSREKLNRQILVFWAAVMLGIALATVLTYFVDQATVHQPTLVRGTAVLVAQVSGFGFVWIGRFFILDRWLFKLADQPLEYGREISVEIPA